VLKLCERAGRNVWHVSGTNGRQPTMMRSVSRRLTRLETRAAAAIARESFCCRVHLVHPEKGLTGILVLESNKEVERVRVSLQQRRDAARLPGLQYSEDGLVLKEGW
jgi:hypothetical protein